MPGVPSRGVWTQLDDLFRFRSPSGADIAPGTAPAVTRPRPGDGQPMTLDARVLALEERILALENRFHDLERRVKLAGLPSDRAIGTASTDLGFPNFSAAATSPASDRKPSAASTGNLSGAKPSQRPDRR